MKKKTHLLQCETNNALTAVLVKRWPFFKLKSACGTYSPANGGHTSRIDNKQPRNIYQISKSQQKKANEKKRKIKIKLKRVHVSNRILLRPVFMFFYLNNKAK